MKHSIFYQLLNDNTQEATGSGRAKKKIASLELNLTILLGMFG
jgi:hypothetical protein